MDEEEHDLRSSNGVLSRVARRATETSSDFVDGSAVETVKAIKTEEKACHSGENDGLEPKKCELGSTNQVKQGTIIENPTNLGVGVVVETSDVINPSEAPTVSENNAVSNAKVGELGLSKMTVEESKVKMSESEKQSCVVDISCGSAKSCVDKWDGQRVCRICHLSSDQSPDRAATTCVADLIHLGCGCKDDLGVAHYQCAEAWFKLKGNRMCEICGETAKNITGFGDIRFMEEWNERFTRSDSISSERHGGCWHGQPFCNFLMACLVVAFVLPWFFRVNMF